MWSTLCNFWNSYGFEILIVLVLIGALLYKLWNGSKQGTWSTAYNYTPKKRGVSRRAYSTPTGYSKGELECRRVLEKLFSRPFPSVRPSFLRNPVTGTHNLELDCYNADLRLAVEYNGRQHYEHTSYFHRSKDTFHYQKARDWIKEKLCNDHGVTLITVPYTVKISGIEGYLRKELQNRGWL